MWIELKPATNDDEGVIIHHVIIHCIAMLGFFLSLIFGILICTLFDAAFSLVKNCFRDIDHCCNKVFNLGLDNYSFAGLNMVKA